MRRFLARIFTRRFLIRGVFVIACLLTILAAFYVIEGSRGRRAWEAYRAEAERAGTKLEIAAYLPPPVSDHENFADVPIIAELFQSENSESPAQRVFALPDLPGIKRPTRMPFSNDPFNAVAWRDFLQKGGWIDASTQDPARDILHALERHRANLAALHEAGLRPKAHFPLNWQDGFGVRLPHLPLLQQASSLLSLRASAELQLADPAAAHSDLSDLLRLYRALEGEPLLITALVRISILGQAFPPILDGLVAGRWTDTQLQEFERKLGDLRVLDGLQAALGCERAVINQELLKIAQGSTREFALLFGLADENLPLGARMGASAFPRGWLYQNLVVINRLFDNRAARTDLKAQTIAKGPTSEEMLRDMIGHSWHSRLRYPFAHMIFPAFETVETRHLMTLAHAGEVQTACALERYRRAHGNFPSQLDALVPKFLPSLPRDPVDGSSFHYRADPNGGYTLWSIGADRKDDGGRSDATKDAIAGPDWVLTMEKPTVAQP